MGRGKVGRVGIRWVWVNLSGWAVAEWDSIGWHGVVKFGEKWGGVKP